MAELIEFTEACPPDAEERQQALDIERSWLVEAPAGSGKTGLLVQRYLSLLGDKRVSEPEEILAITFTRAAAEEIRNRVVLELRRADDHIPPKTSYDRTARNLALAVLDRDQTLGWDLLKDPRRLRVRTIDAVCGEIARSLPLLSGGGSALTPSEDPSALYTEASRRTWMQLGGEDGSLTSSLRELLLHRDGDLDACIELVAGMLADRERWSSMIPKREDEVSYDVFDGALRSQLNATLKKVICETLTRSSAAIPEHALQRLSAVAAALSEREGYSGRASPIEICRGLTRPPGSRTEDLEHWRALTHLLLTGSGKWRAGFNSNHIGFETNAADKLALRELAIEMQQHDHVRTFLQDISALPSPDFPEEQWPLVKALFYLLRRALAELQAVFSETGLCDFAEFSLLARSALARQDGAQDVDAALGIKLKHLLVDEMQDTSSHQYDLLERLTANWTSEHNTVFLVGDPKQSIYLFRHARVERFIEMMRSRRLGSLPLGLLRLSANFRSKAGLVQSFNEDFSRVFSPSNTEIEGIEYLPVVASREGVRLPSEEGGVDWHLSAISNVDKSKGLVHQELVGNAREIRKIIERWKRRSLPRGRNEPWRIAVLVQSRSCLRDLMPELRRHPAVAINAVKIDRLDERHEVLDLLALTRALLHPADRTAWLAVLRAPWCGLTAADLHSLTGKDDEQYRRYTTIDLVRVRLNNLSDDGQLRLKRVWPVLLAAFACAGEMRLPVRVERTWHSLGGPRFLGSTALQNVDTFFGLLRAIDAEAGEVQLSNLTRRMQQLFAAPDQSEGAIDVTTIHQAKGLEWDLVLVPELERRAPPAKSRLFEYEELPSGGTLIAPIAAKGTDATKLTMWLRRIHLRRETAERKRLFYVACTRAREELHLFGVALENESGQKKVEPSSLLDAAWSAAAVRFPQSENLSLTRRTYKQTVFSFAASAADTELHEESPSFTLQRLPLDFQRAFPSSLPNDTAVANSSVARTVPVIPEGSFISRCVGTTVHLLLEEIARELEDGAPVHQLVDALPSFEARATALLRAHGLAHHSIREHKRTVLRALRNTLLSPTGTWLLGARRNARNEFGIVHQEDTIRRYRIDRLFRAGATPGELGDRYLWIIDYKTSSYSGSVANSLELESFLQEERARYLTQLQTYARLMQEGEPVRLGLWFPLLGHLSWWTDHQPSVLITSSDQG